jgi:putative membrane protein
MRLFSRREKPSVWKGLVAGLAGGLAATVVMTEFQKGWQKAAKALEEKNGHSRKSKSRSQESKSDQPRNEQKEDATMKAAGKVASAVGHPASFRQKKKAGPFVHYGFGATMGALYGVMQEIAPRAMRTLNPVVSGIGFGSALFIGADEVAVPALGLSGSPKKTPLSGHLHGLASHLVYGVTGESVRRTVRHYL